MNPKFLLLMSFLSFFGCGKKAPEYPADTLTTRDGTQITLTFFKHASLAIEASKMNLPNKLTIFRVLV